MDFLSKYFVKVPSGYTANYVFEFTKGVLTMRTLCTTPDASARRINMLRSSIDYETQKIAIIKDLFGVESVDKASMLKLRLEKHEGIELKSTKLKSLAKKYFSIPEKFRGYYPKLDKQLDEIKQDNSSDISVLGKRNKLDKSLQKSKKKRRKVGRPKKVRKPLVSVLNTPSILTFFKVE